jgi:hypothetical protein
MKLARWLTPVLGIGAAIALVAWSQTAESASGRSLKARSRLRPQADAARAFQVSRPLRSLAASTVAGVRAPLGLATRVDDVRETPFLPLPRDGRARAMRLRVPDAGTAALQLWTPPFSAPAP